MVKRTVGFTIVELLIVIVIIGILATVTIVSYMGIAQKANIASIKSDLKQAGNLLSMYQVSNDEYPDSVDLINSGLGLPSSQGITYNYTKISNIEFCLTAKHEDLNNVGYFINQDNRTPTLGFCPGDAPPLTMENSVVSTVAGSGVGGSIDGPAASAQFYMPYGLDIDGSGNIYIADSLTQRIRKITSDGIVSTLAGSTAGFADGPVATSQFYWPADVALDNDGNIYIADGSNHRIRKITPAGVVSTLAGSGVAGFADGVGANAQFYSPYSVAIDSSGDIYVADVSNHRIRKITPAGVVSTLAGSSTYGFLDGMGTSAQFYGPNGIAIDRLDNIYVADKWNNRIRKITPAGVVSTLAGSGTRGFIDGTGASAQFYWPTHVVVDRNGNIYVGEGSHRIRKITPAGVVSTLAGSSEGFNDGDSIDAKFNQPSGLAIDGSGNIYISDRANNRIRKISLE